MRTLSRAIAAFGLAALACSNDSHGGKSPDAGSSAGGGGAAGSGASGAASGRAAPSGGSSGQGGGRDMRPDAAVLPPGAGGTHTDAGPPPCAAKAIRCNGVCLEVGAPASGNCSLLTEVDGVENIGVADSGDVYLARRTTNEASIVHVPAAGGAATPLETEHLAVAAIIVDDTNVYFETNLETSMKYQRLTGSIGVVPRAGGALKWLVRDIPNGVFRKTATHFYVGAQQILPGIRRYDLDGSNETLLSTVNVNDFVVGTDEIYVIQDTFQPITRLPITGVGNGTADASAPLAVLGGGQCETIFRMDSEALYAVCGDFKRIALSDGAATRLASRPTNAWPYAEDGKYFYYAYSKGYMQLQTIERVPLTGGAPEKIASVDGKQPIVSMIARGGALFVLADLGLNIIQPFPGFVLKIDLTK